MVQQSQEATVYNWNVSPGEHGQPTLETLFVKLTNPPSDVKFDGLPDHYTKLQIQFTVRCLMIQRYMCQEPR